MRWEGKNVGDRGCEYKKSAPAGLEYELLEQDQFRRCNVESESQIRRQQFAMRPLNMIEGHSERPKRGRWREHHDDVGHRVYCIYPVYCEHLVDRKRAPLGLFSRTPAAM